VVLVLLVQVEQVVMELQLQSQVLQLPTAAVAAVAWVLITLLNQVVLVVVEQEPDAQLLTEHLEQQTQAAAVVRQTLVVKAAVLVVLVLSFLGIQIRAQFQLAQV
jgi:hypothetical protein